MSARPGSCCGALVYPVDHCFPLLCPCPRARGTLHVYGSNLAKSDISEDNSYVRLMVKIIIIRVIIIKMIIRIIKRIIIIIIITIIVIIFIIIIALR